MSGVGMGLPLRGLLFRFGSSVTSDAEEKVPDRTAS
jgi:hypothetical protein